MCKVMSIINNKGGVGKTTSTCILSELLAYLGKRVLVIDLDQQSNLSMMLNCYFEDSDNIVNGLELPPPDRFNISELFRHRYQTKEQLHQIIKASPIPNIDIIPASRRHRNTPDDIRKNTGNNNTILKRALNSIKENYDFILIDNAPASDILTVNSMFASDLVFVPVRVEEFSYKGLKETIDSILYIKQEHELETIEFGGAFITQAETATKAYKDSNALYQNELGSRFLKTPIRKDTKVSEIEKNFKPILEYCPDTNVVFDYSRLLLEMNLLDEQSRRILVNSISAA